MRMLGTAATTLLLSLSIASPVRAQQPDFKAIAEEAIVYGFPLVMNYGVMYESFIDKSSDQYRCPFNQIHNTARVFTPQDTAVVTPNSDTPYSFFCADLRAEPVVFTVPAIPKPRYFSVQLIDWYTFNFGYVGSRTTGSDGGSFLIAGPSWNGKQPPESPGSFVAKPISPSPSSALSCSNPPTSNM